MEFQVRFYCKDDYEYVAVYPSSLLGWQAYEDACNNVEQGLLPSDVVNNYIADRTFTAKTVSLNLQEAKAFSVLQYYGRADVQVQPEALNNFLRLKPKQKRDSENYITLYWWVVEIDEEELMAAWLGDGCPLIWDNPQPSLD